MSATSIYRSGWSPRGVRRSWERSSIAAASAQRVLSRIDFDWGKVVDACAWFDEGGALRVLVADTDTSRRLTYRRTKRHFTIESEART